MSHIELQAVVVGYSGYTAYLNGILQGRNVGGSAVLIEYNIEDIGYGVGLRHICLVVEEALVVGVAAVLLLAHHLVSGVEHGIGVGANVLIPMRIVGVALIEQVADFSAGQLLVGNLCAGNVAVGSLEVGVTHRHVDGPAAYGVAAGPAAGSW